MNRGVRMVTRSNAFIPQHPSHGLSKPATEVSGTGLQLQYLEFWWPHRFTELANLHDERLGLLVVLLLLSCVFCCFSLSLSLHLYLFLSQFLSVSGLWVVRVSFRIGQSPVCDSSLIFYSVQSQSGQPARGSGLGSFIIALVGACASFKGIGNRKYGPLY